jgi:hypothetical protein
MQPQTTKKASSIILLQPHHEEKDDQQHQSTTITCHFCKLSKIKSQNWRFCWLPIPLLAIFLNLLKNQCEWHFKVPHIVLDGDWHGEQVYHTLKPMSSSSNSTFSPRRTRYRIKSWVLDSIKCV